MINFSTPMTHCTLARQYGANIRNEHSLGGVKQTKRIVADKLKAQLENGELSQSQYQEMIDVLKEMNL
jgi:hypothetical protein